MKKILNRIIIILVLLFLLFGIGYFGTGMFGKLGKLDIFKSKGAQTDKQSAANAYTEYSAGISADGLSTAASVVMPNGSPAWAGMGEFAQFVFGDVKSPEISVDWWNRKITVTPSAAFVEVFNGNAVGIQVEAYSFLTERTIVLGSSQTGMTDYDWTLGKLELHIPSETENLSVGSGKGFSYDELKSCSVLALISTGESVVAAYGAFKDYSLSIVTEEEISGQVEQGRTEGYEQGKTEGYEQGKTDGAAEGFESGRVDGIEQGKAEGYEQGKTDGIEQGKNEGYTSGKIDGYTQGKTDGQAEGFEKGKLDGYAAGEADGFSKAKAEAFDVADYGMFDFLKTSAGKNLIAFLSCVLGLVLVLSALSIASGVKARGC